jgi:type IV pilus assembly protein PilF
MRGLPILLATMLFAIAGCASIPADAPSSGAHQADAQRRAEIRLQLASAYFAEGQYATALAELDQAYLTGQRRADVLGLRALVLMQQGDATAATRSLKQALQTEPDHPGLLNNMGWLLCETGHYEEGQSYFRRALTHRGYATPGKVLLNAGRCSERAGRRDEAAEFFRQALRVDPGQLGAHASLARLAFEAGDYHRAKVHMLRVLSGDRPEKDDYLMAMAIERKLGDAAAEQSIAQQWKKRFSGTAREPGSVLDNANER